MIENIPVNDDYHLDRRMFPLGFRWIGDESCWEFRLATDKSLTPSEHIFYPHLNGWELVQRWETGWKAHFWPLKSSAVFYKYVFPPGIYWKKFVCKWLDVEPVTSSSGDIIYGDSELEFQFTAAKSITNEIRATVNRMAELGLRLNMLDVGYKGNHRTSSMHSGNV